MRTSLPLGKKSNYSNTLDRSCLAAISRKDTRASLPANILEQAKGQDIWHGFELSCLDKAGKPKNFWFTLSVPSDSPEIIESKSLKLYLGSLFDQTFESEHALKEELLQALSKTSSSNSLELELYAPEHWPRLLRERYSNTPSIDHLASSAEFQGLRFAEKEISSELVFHGFRAVCPVTSQPDYASVALYYQGPELDPTSYANYLLSFRREPGFHEFWAEKIFCDLMSASNFKQLRVQLWFARRGGISINPYRETSGFFLSAPKLTFLR